MRSLTLLGASDFETASEIASFGYRYLFDTSVQRIPRYVIDIPKNIGTYAMCPEASDAVTRASLELGFVASRELHNGGHMITSFASFDAEPSEQDLIMCLTWGQFNQKNFLELSKKTGASPVYFGPRSEIMPLLDSPSTYQGAFSAMSTVFRQRAFTASIPNDGTHKWLGNTPKLIFDDHDPIGLQSRADFPNAHWI